MMATKNLHLEQLDMEIIFLHDDLEEDINMHCQRGSQYKEIRALFVN